MKKKYSLLLAIMVSLLLVTVLSWIIPSGSYYYGTFNKGDIVPLGLGDLFKIPLWTFSTIFQFSLIFLIIGGFYGVLNKTGVYDNLVENIVKKFKKKSHLFVIITVVILALLSSLVGWTTYLFLLVPFFVTVLLKLGYGKCTSLLSTVGALFAGVVGSTYSFEINGYINYYLSLDLHAGIIYKIVLFILTVGLLLLFVLKIAKKEDKVEIDAIPLYEENKKDKKSVWPLAIVTILGIIIYLVGTYSWNDMFGISFFTDVYTAIKEATISGYPLFANVLGTITEMGYWSMQDVNITIILMSLLIGWIYSIKLKDIANAFVKGAKEMLPTFIYATLANILIVILMNSNTGQFINYTIMNFLFTLTEGFNALAYGLGVLVDSFVVNYFPYLSSDVLNPAITVYKDATVYPIIGLVTQAVYGLTMFILPTSLVLISGLAYLNISYKEWFKYIWKFLLFLIGLIVLVVLIASLLI